jgi:aryl-alcohol dehydrogenase-like predicted oxidoreductase
MQTKTLGRTGLEVSVAGLGCGGHSRLGMTAGKDEAYAARVVSHALDLGINFIDTARAYRTETAVGKAIAGRREEVVISTKVSAGRADTLLTAEELTASLEKSLDRLGTDYVDVFHLHGVRPEQYDHCIDVLVPEMRRQRDLGKLRFLGITEQFVGDPEHRMLQRALPEDHFDVVMVGFNLLNPSARERVFPQTLENDVGTLIMFAVRRALSQPVALKELVDALVARREVDARDLNGDDPLQFVREHAEVSSVVDAAYRFCRHEPGAHVILTGTGNPEHLTQNVAAIQGPPLPDDINSALRRLFGGVDSVSGN